MSQAGCNGRKSLASPGLREPGRQLYEAMKELEQSNPDVLDGVLGGLGFPAELGQAEVEILISVFLAGLTQRREPGVHRYRRRRL